MNGGRLLASEKLRFLAVGAFNTGFGYVLFAVLVLTISRVLHYTLLLVVTYSIMSVIAFYLHRTFVFSSRGPVLGELRRYALVHSGTLLANLVLLPLLVEVAGLHVLAAQWGAVLIIPALSYGLHKRFSFGARPVGNQQLRDDGSDPEGAQPGRSAPPSGKRSS